MNLYSFSKLKIDSNIIIKLLDILYINDPSKFDEYKEDNRHEVKKAKEGLPLTLWDSYSALANSNGGVILLGVSERDAGTWYNTG